MVWGIYLAIAFVLSGLVYGDATENSPHPAALWSLVAFLFSLLGVIIYILVGRDPHTSGRTEIWRCRECGEEINRDDRFCPGCGVQLEVLECESCGEPTGGEDEFCSNCGAELDASSFSRRGDDDHHSSTEYESNVSDAWYYGLLGGPTASVISFILYIILPIDIVGSIMIFVMTISWAVIIVCLYKDTQYMRANSNWDTENRFWIVAFGAVPYLNIAIAVGYLYKRYLLCRIAMRRWNSCFDG